MAEELSCLRRHGRPISRKFGGPDFARGAFQFGDNFVNDRITGLRQIEAGDRLDRVSDRQHLQGEHV